MIAIRQAADRGRARHGWLESFHTFSFAGYYDPEHMGFSDLRVLNEDRVQPGRGFDAHSHRDMEIISYVLEGALEHADSMGNGSIIRPGEVQVMSAGTGVTHSEYNPSEREIAHLLQIWIEPAREGLEPSYGQKHFPESERLGTLRLVASSDGRNGSLQVAQDMSLHAGLLEEGQSVEHGLAPGRRAWVQVARGRIGFNGHVLAQGDGAAVTGETRLQLVGASRSELLVFDLR
jgi:redox-sensitive bicupin YhaK (pirin superfamily)